MKFRPRWYVVALALLVVGIAYMSVKSLLDPSDDIPQPAPVGPSMPPGYAVDWVPLGGQTYPCVRHVHEGISCDFSRPSPTPTPGPTRS